MRNFRMEKLAGFMKMAENDLNLGNDTAFDVSVKREGQAVETVLKPGMSMSVDSTIRLEMSWTDATAKKNSTVVGPIKLQSFLKKDGTKGAVNLSQLSNQFTSTSAAPQSAGGASGAKAKPKGTPARPLAISHTAGTKLKDNDYTYKVEDPNSKFTWIENKKNGTSGTFELNTVGVSKWNQAVTRLNDSKLTTIIPVPPAPATAPSAAATTAPPAAAATSGSNAQAELFDPDLVANVATILLNASTRAYASLIPGNQKQQLTSMFEAIRTAVSKLGSGVSNPSEFLAKLIIGSVGPQSLAGIGAIKNIGSLNERQIKREAGQEVTRIMRAVNETYNRYGGDEPKKMSAAFSSVMKKTEAPAAPPAAPVTPPATPVAPAAEADDGQVKKSSLDKKFIKAATLRRLKIRSQMEAAIDSSAQMGRARVY